MALNIADKENIGQTVILIGLGYIFVAVARVYDYDISVVLREERDKGVSVRVLQDEDRAILRIGRDVYHRKRVIARNEREIAAVFGD